MLVSRLYAPLFIAFANAVAVPNALASPDPATDTALVAFHWQLTSATDASGQRVAAFFPTPGQPPGVQFAGGRLSVTGSCNHMSTQYELLDGTRLQLGRATSTMMACPPALAQADAAFGRFLMGTLHVTIEEVASAAPRLRLAAPDGATLAFMGTTTPESRFGSAGTRAFLEVSTQPCPAPESSQCLMVRDRHFNEPGLKTGTPGAWRALPAGIEGYTRVAGEQQVVRVKRFEQPARAGAAAEEHFVLDMVVESRKVP